MNHIDANHILNYFTDDENVFAIAKAKDSLLVQCINPSTLEVITEFPAQFRFHPGCLPCVDDNSLYLPTFDGLLLSLDKFAGEKNWQTNISNKIITGDLGQDDQHLYAPSSVPLCDGKQTYPDYRCLVVFDKETGKQKVQSKAYHTRRLQFLVDDLITVLTASELAICDQDCRQLAKIDTNRDYKWGPFRISNRIVCALPGRLDVFSLEKKRSQYYVSPATCPPIKKDDALFWFAEKGLYRIGLEDNTASIEPIADYPKYIFKDATAVGDKLIALRNDGAVVIWNGNIEKRSAIQNAEKFDRIVVVGNHIIIKVNETLFSIEV